MRDIVAIFRAIVFCAFTAGSIASLTDTDTSSVTNGMMLAAGAGLGLGLLLTALIPTDRR